MRVGAVVQETAVVAGDQHRRASGGPVDPRPPSMGDLLAWSRWLVGSSRSSASGLCRPRRGEQRETLPAAAQGRDLAVTQFVRSLEVVQHRVDPPTLVLALGRAGGRDARPRERSVRAKQAARPARRSRCARRARGRCCLGPARPPRRCSAAAWTCRRRCRRSARPGRRGRCCRRYFERASAARRRQRHVS